MCRIIYIYLLLGQNNPLICMRAVYPNDCILIHSIKKKNNVSIIGLYYFMDSLYYFIDIMAKKQKTFMNDDYLLLCLINHDYSNHDNW